MGAEALGRRGSLVKSVSHPAVGEEFGDKSSDGKLNWTVLAVLGLVS